ncbi:MAG: hypothetical protein ACTHU0_35735 [Kofleriaceae bacterium]
MLKTVRVPAALAPAFEIAQAVVRREFATMAHHPEEGTLRIGGERYVLLRADSLYLGWYTALRSTFGDEAATGFIYSTAREIGRNDGLAFGEKLGLSEGIARLATGPVHFAHSGWAFVDIFPDSAPTSDDAYFLHYSHPNTFESEVQRARRTEGPAMTCQFSAGYSAGWCTAAFGVEVHAREIHCLSRGDALCEFIMAPAHRLDEHAARLGYGS